MMRKSVGRSPKSPAITPSKSPAITPPIAARTRRKSLAAGKVATPATSPYTTGKKRQSIVSASTSTLLQKPNKSTPNRKSIVANTPVKMKKESEEEKPIPEPEKSIIEKKDSAKNDESSSDEAIKDNNLSGDEASKSDQSSEEEAAENGQASGKEIDIEMEGINDESDEEKDVSGSEDEASVEKSKKSKQSKQKKTKSGKNKSIMKEVDQSANTIFVGNLPKSTEKRDLIKLFSKYGKLSSIRLRNAPVADTRTPKKIAVIKKEFHNDRANINAYVVFAKADSAKKALQEDGSQIGDRHIRVTMLNAPAPDQRKAIFVGNLPFVADEEDLRKVFESCGTITSLRIIRDKSRGVGKGFAFINFDTTGAVELAILKEGEVTLGKRVLRIQRSKTIKKRGKKSKTKSSSAGKTFEKTTTQVQNGKPSSPSKSPKIEKSVSSSPSKKPKIEKSFTGEKTVEKGKIKKKQGGKKMTPKKKAAVETLLNTMSGKASQKKSPKGFDRYFNQTVK